MNRKGIIEPYGGELINLLVKDEEKEAWLDKANQYPSHQLSDRSLHDLELLAVGGFSPLNSFMGEEDYNHVLTEMRLSDGTLFPIPITLKIEKEDLPARGEWITLRDSRNYIIAVMRIEDVYRWDPIKEAQSVLGSTDHRHPLVSEMDQWGDICISGELKVINLPMYYDFTDIRMTPVEVREILKKIGNDDVTAF